MLRAALLLVAILTWDFPAGAQQQPGTGDQKPKPAAPETTAADKAAADKTAPDKAAAGAPQGKPEDKAKGKDAKTFSPEQMEQIVAPIALYADSLLAQTMMAATYPLEIVQAARWVQKNPKLKGDELEKALQDQPWDPAVKALCGLPEVLNRLNENLDWTQDLGDAFLADQAALMDAVQRMRQKALDAGNLKTTDEQKVTQRDDKIIVVASTNPEVVYVPTYYPTVVYGTWSYPHWYYPPMYPAYPPGYPAFTFAAGVFWGAAIWGGCSWGWGHTDVNIDIDRQNNFIDRTERPEHRAERRQQRGDNKFQHRPEHRQGVRYRDQATAQRFAGDRATTGNRVPRDQARGFDRSSRPSTTQRPSTGSGGRPSSSVSTRPSTGQRSGSFSGARQPQLDRAASRRGSASRGSGGRAGGRSGGGRAGGRGR